MYKDSLKTNLYYKITLKYYKLNTKQLKHKKFSKNSVLIDRKRTNTKKF